MDIVVASGKGGTGKTTFAVNMAHAIASTGKETRLLDCDVEEPNDHLFVRPTFTTTTDVRVLKPLYDEAKCTGCGKCAEVCASNAIAVVKGKALIFNELCHSCGACSYICPENALTEVEVSIGSVQIDPDHKPYSFCHGTLNISEPLAPAVVKQVKEELLPDAVNIIDASPGTACPVVEAVDHMDVAVLVTEPTPFGLNDLKLAVGLTLKLSVPTGILVNRSDGTDSIIADYAKEVGLPIVGRIPFRREYAETYSSGKLLAVEHPELTENLLGIYDRVCTLKDTTPPPVPDQELFPISAEGKLTTEKGEARSFREITVISGKGGTGKTTTVGSLAKLAQNKVLADNDVDAADLHLLLAPRTVEEVDFYGGSKARVHPETCVACGRCAALCHFDSIRQNGPVNSAGKITFRVDPLGCEGCGLCVLACPVKAIEALPTVVGKCYVSQTESGPMAHAKLGIAEDNSGRLVTQVRQRAAELAEEFGQGLILGDGPPGTGCPVIASISGSDLVLIVTEPTVSGVHDMERVLRLTAHFGVKAKVIINKADLNEEQAHRIEEIADAMNAPVIGRIPFDRNVNDALMAGLTVVEYGKGPAAKAMHEVWSTLQQDIKEMNG